eukprot:1159101-Pelagomonas_calceolata.AAC.2
MQRSMGIRRVTSSIPFLISFIRVERSLLMSMSRASKFLGAMDRMSMELQIKPGGFMSVKSKLSKGLQSVRGLKLILGPVIFTIFDLHKIDVPQFWKELTRVTDLGSRWSGSSWCSVLPVPPAPPSTSQQILGTGSVQGSASCVKQVDLRYQCPWRQGLPQEGLCLHFQGFRGRAGHINKGLRARQVWGTAITGGQAFQGARAGRGKTITIKPCLRAQQQRV